jgi:uncharacterized protein
LPASIPTRPNEAPYLGVGVGLRTVHYPEIFRRVREGDPLGVDWLEALSENYMVEGGRPKRVLDELCGQVPLVLHGVSLNIGSSDPLDARYLAELRQLADATGALWVSDHLCWTGVDGRSLHDLMPLPFTTDALRHVVERVKRVQGALGRRIALENVSSYLSYSADAMPEWEFLAGIAEGADCGILLDVNNIFVSSHNHGFDGEDYLAGIPPERVFQMHLAGHSEAPPLLIDTHDHPVRPEVWTLFESAVRRMGPVSTLIEWDDLIPSYEELLEEAERARAILDRVCAAPVEPRIARAV